MTRALPPLARRLLEYALPEDVRDEITGDFIELYHRVRARDGWLRALVWCWREVLFCSGRMLMERLIQRIGGRRATAASRPTAGSFSGRGGSSRLMRSWSAWRYDLAVAFRNVAREPGFAISVIATLALGIGANHVMVRVLDRILLRPPEHIADAGSVVRVFLRSVATGHARVDFKPSMSYPIFRDLDQGAAFANAAAYAFDNPVVGEGVGAETVLSQWATADLFTLLGVTPAVGRFFSPWEDRVGSPRTVVLAWSYWRRRFGGDPRVLGRSLRIGAESYTVVGVAPSGFTGPTLARVQLWLPLHPTASIEAGEGWTSARGWNWISVVGRLAPGVTIASAQAEASRVVGAHGGVGRIGDAPSAVLTSLRAADEPEVPTWASVAKWLGGVSLIVWLIAAANVANLMLAREMRRRRETALRLALGVTRVRLLSQFMTEAVVLALPAALLAAAIAHWGGPLLGGLLLPEISLEGAFGGGGGTVLWYTLATGVLTAFLAGVVPALQAGRRDVVVELKVGRGNGVSRSRVQDGLLVVQVAFSVVLLVAAGLFVRSLQNVESSANVGVDAGGVILAQLFLDDQNEAHPESNRIFRDAVDRIARLPSVERAAAATYAPFTGGRGVELRLRGGLPLPEAPERTVGPDQVHVTPGYFASVGLSIVVGRGFRASDDAVGAERVAVVSRSMADHYWAGRDAIGACLWIDGERSCTTVVGVSSDLRGNGPGWRPTLLLYLPLAQRNALPRDLVIRVSGDRDLDFATVRKELYAVSPMIRFVGVRSLSTLVATHSAPWRLGSVLCSAFGGLALVVAGVGLYGLLAFRVAQTRHAIALRSALGASHRRLEGMVVKEAAILVGASVTAGLAIAAMAAPWLEPLLFQVPARDVQVYTAVTFVLATAALLASSLPARRAARVEPAQVLRGD